MSYDGIPDSVLAQYPAMPPPLGVKSNFIDPPSRDAALIALNAVFLASMVIVVFVRLYVKIFVIRKLWWDDYTCAIAAVASIAHSVMMLTNLQLGYGRHLWDITALTLTILSNVRRLAGTAIIYPFVIYFVKLSILLLYLRLFGVYRGIRIGVYAGVVFLTLFYIAYLGVQAAYMADCTTEASLSVAPCSSIYGVTIFQGALNVASDFYVLLLPLRRIVQLHIKRREKIGLLVIFLAGFVACAVSIVRLVITAITLNRMDKYWYASLSSEFTIVEINLAIIATCMPAMPSFFVHTKMFGSHLFRSLRSRLFESGSKSATSNMKGESESKGSEGHKANFSAQYGEAYIPLEEGSNIAVGSNRSLEEHHLEGDTHAPG